MTCARGQYDARVKKCARCGDNFSAANTRESLSFEYEGTGYAESYKGDVCMECVDREIDYGLDGEVWFECGDCEGTKKVSIPVGGDESVCTLETCPGCDGLGFYEGTTDDLPSDARRVFEF